MSDRVSMRSAWGSRLGSRRLLNLAMALLGGVMLAPPAFAYRPFDGTNGEVSDPGEFELEVGSAYLTTGARYMVAPATVLNFGVAPGLELVADFKNFVGLQRVAGKPRLQLLETDIFLKRVLRRGALQGEPGVSIALEAGPLLPEINGVNAFGAQASLITSYRWDALSLHLNTAAVDPRAPRGRLPRLDRGRSARLGGAAGRRGLHRTRSWLQRDILGAGWRHLAGPRPPGDRRGRPPLRAGRQRHHRSTLWDDSGSRSLRCRS